MGAGASKEAGKAAAAAGRRQYPSSSSIMNSASSTGHAPGNPNTNTTSANTSATIQKPSQVHPDPQTAPPTDKKDPHVDLDGRDPHFGAALRRLGPAVSADQASSSNTVFPTSSRPPLGQQGQNIFPNTQTSNNPSLMVVRARDRISQQYEDEMDSMGRKSFGGRTLLSARDIREALRLRDELGREANVVEKQMRLKPGILNQLATPGVVANVL